VLHHRGPDGRWSTLRKGIPDEHFFGIAVDASGHLWFFTFLRLWVVDPATGEVEEKIDFMRDHRIWRGFVDGGGTLWFGSTKGLVRVDGDGELRDAPGVPADLTYAVSEDHEGSLWAGGLGLHRLAGRGAFRIYDRAEGLPSASIWGIQRDSGGRLWVGTRSGLASASESKWEPAPSVPPLSFKAILPDPSNGLWLGGEAAAVLHYEPASGRVDRFPLEGESEEVHTQVYAMTFAPASRLWAASSAGIFSADLARGAPRFLRVAVPGEGARAAYTDVHEDRGGRLWFASSDGLLFLQEGVYHRFTVQDGLRSNDIHFLAGRGDELCVSYANLSAVDCFGYHDNKLARLAAFDESRGLASSGIYLLRADRRERLWVGSGQGVDLIEGDRVIDHFDRNNGLPGDNISGWSFLAEANGDVWIGTSSGLGRFQGDRYTGPPAPPPTVITAARGGGADLLVPGAAREVPYYRNSVEVDHAVPSFVNEAAIQRQVRLIGADERWQPISEHQARFFGLAAGGYELQVRARYRLGEFGPVASLTFTILPPWWQTWWFRAASALALAASVALIAAARQSALRRRNTELEALVNARTRELRDAQALVVRLEKEATEQQMAGGFAHEMRNTLISARMRISRAEGTRLGEPGLAEATQQLVKALYLLLRDIVPEAERPRIATHIKQLRANVAGLDAVVRDTGARIDRAFVLTRAILDYARLGRESPGRERVELRALLAAILADLELNDIEVELAVPAGAAVTGSPAHWRSILENLMRNARDAVADRSGPEPRRICVRVEEHPEELLLRVEDTGTGIAAEDLERVFEPFFSTKPTTGTGLGLGVVRKLVALHGGTIVVESERGRGTLVRLTLPRDGKTV